MIPGCGAPRPRSPPGGSPGRSKGTRGLPRASSEANQATRSAATLGDRARLQERRRR
jgi:hypothetical protein